jgi:hypothetical protein
MANSLLNLALQPCIVRVTLLKSLSFLYVHMFQHIKMIISMKKGTCRLLLLSKHRMFKTLLDNIRNIHFEVSFLSYISKYMYTTFFPYDSLILMLNNYSISSHTIIKSCIGHRV